MPRWTIALALLAAPVWAQEPEEIPHKGIVEERIDDVVIDFAAPGRISRGERDAPTTFARLREGGALQVKQGEEWKDATLDQFAKFLKVSLDHRDGDMKKEGKSAYETIPGAAGKVSRLFVSIDVEPTVPWQHVQWLMMVAAEQKHYKLELSAGTRKMLVFLPVDRCLEAPVEPPLEVKISVHAIARTEKRGKWGEAEVLRPVDVRYKLGSADEETPDVAVVKDYIRKAQAAVKDTPNCILTGEIKAGNKVPSAKILDLIETFDAAGLTDMEFYGTAIPPKEVREAARLPYPLKNYDPEH